MDQPFVILEHTASGGTHFDLMLKVPGQEKLRTWQLQRWPLAPGETCPCREIAPHREAYLTYEGEISGGRGSVRRVASGTWSDAGDKLVLQPDDAPPVTLRIGNEQATRLPD